jgi:hypothetical protein
MPIFLNEKELNHRPKAVQKMLHPLRAKQAVACNFATHASMNQRILGAHDGEISLTRSYRDWWFRTSSNVIRAQYFETWENIGKKVKFQLLNAYLHLSRIDNYRRDQYEIIALHADPKDGNKHKCGPHIHVVKSEQPLPHCHFPMYLENTFVVLESCTSFTSAMKSAIEVLSCEVLERYNDFS